MKGEIELYNISFLILKVELHFKVNKVATLSCLKFLLQIVILILWKNEKLT